MEITKIYLVKRPIDTTEVKGPRKTLAIFTREDTAIEYADMMEPYGHSGQFCSIEEESLVDCAPNFLSELEEQKAKEKALKKLTAKERELLGLK